MPKIAISLTDRERVVVADVLINLQHTAEDSASVVGTFREFDLEAASTNVGRPGYAPMSFQNNIAGAVEVSTEAAAFLLKLIEAKAVRPGYVTITLAALGERIKAALTGNN